MQAMQAAQTTRNQATLQTGAQTTAKQISAGLNNPTRYPVWAARLPLQASLKINAPGDRYEQEADRVADQVMRMPAPQVQRKTCSCGRPAGPDGMCEECKRKQLSIQRMAAGDAPQTTVPPIVHQVLRQPGHPLDTPTRNFMESRFGWDFGQVRMHTDVSAAESAQAVNARAYTVGRDMVFGRGQYSPETLSGRHLLAHEIAHVIQQGDALSGVSTLRRAASDFRITEISPDDTANPDMIFFETGSSAIPASEQHKIAALAIPPGRNLTLNGFSSEEGSDAGNDAIIVARLQSVDAALTAAGHTAARVQVNLRASGEGQIDYRHMRSVEVIPTPVGMAAAPSGVSACSAPGSEVEPCGTAFTGSWPDADKAMKKAVSELGPPVSAAATTLLSTLFGGVAVSMVRTNITNLAAQVAALSGQHRCHNTCDSGCGRPAYNTGAGIAAAGPPVVAGATMTLCPDFLNSGDTAWQARILIHESAHGTTGLSARDIAYANTRQIAFLLPADQERNTDSYVLLAWLLYRPGSIAIGPASPDVLVGMTAAEELASRRSAAWLESWLNYGDFDTEILYDTVNRSAPPAATWDTSQRGDVFNRATMHLLAPIFGLTDPGIAAPFIQPTGRDKTKVAAIHDRYDQMYSTVNWQVLTITKGAVGSDSWGGHGASLPRLDQVATVGPAFFGMTPVDQVRHLVLLMATAMYGISPGFRSKYVDGIDAIRTHRTIGP